MGVLLVEKLCFIDSIGDAIRGIEMWRWIDNLNETDISIKLYLRRFFLSELVLQKMLFIFLFVPFFYDDATTYKITSVNNT